MAANNLWELINFICIFPNAYFLFLLAGQFIERKKGVVSSLFLFTACWLTVSMMIFVGDAFNILFVIPIFFAGIWFCCKGSRLARLSVFLILFPVAISVNGIIDTFIPFDYSNILRVFFWLPAWLLVSKTMPKGHYALSWRLWLLIDLLAAMPFGATLFTVLLGNPEHSNLNYWALGILPFAAVSSIGLLAAIVVLSRHEKLEQEQNLWQLRELYYQNLEATQLQVRRLRHDMANHLQTLASLEGDSAKAYLAQLINAPAVNAGARFCENETVNAVLNSKQFQIEQEQIKSDIQAALPADLPIADIDLCALFANSLDNAIEASRKLPREQRAIKLRTKADKGLFVMQLENARPEELRREKRGGAGKDGNFLTTKPDRRLHGLGLSNMREIAGRYRGTMKTQATETGFLLLISIPLADDIT